MNIINIVTGKIYGVSLLLNSFRSEILSNYMIELLRYLEDKLFIIEVTFEMIDFGNEAEECDTGGGNEERCHILVRIFENVDIERDHSGHGGALDKM